MKKIFYFLMAAVLTAFVGCYSEANDNDVEAESKVSGNELTDLELYEKIDGHWDLDGAEVLQIVMADTDSEQKLKREIFEAYAHGFFPGYDFRWMEADNEKSTLDVICGDIVERSNFIIKDGILSFVCDDQPIVVGTLKIENDVLYLTRDMTGDYKRKYHTLENLKIEYRFLKDRKPGPDVYPVYEFNGSEVEIIQNSENIFNLYKVSLLSGKELPVGIETISEISFDLYLTDADAYNECGGIIAASSGDGESMINIVRNPKIEYTQSGKQFNIGYICLTVSLLENNSSEITGRVYSYAVAESDEITREYFEFTYTGNVDFFGLLK